MWAKNQLDFLDHESTIALIFGYFRNNEFLHNNIKYDDFVNIVSKYFVEPTIKFGNNNKAIDAFNRSRLYYITAKSKDFVVSLDYSSRIMLSIMHATLYSVFEFKTNLFSIIYYE